MITNYREFVRESNRIEGYHHEPTNEEIRTLQNFVLLPRLTVSDVVDFVKFTQPDARLRNNISVPGVRVGNHIAPPSGPEIEHYLGVILGDMQFGKNHTYNTHLAYLNLHPFTDGNGRSARAIWLWQMNGNAPLGFLHTFYYQALDCQNPGRG